MSLLFVAVIGSGYIVFANCMFVIELAASLFGVAAVT